MSEETKHIAVLILAAGESSRMGTAKQLLPWKSTTLIEHSLKTALQVSSNVFVILGANAELIQNKIQSYPVEVILNDHWNNGLGSSIACGVNYIQKLKANFDGVMILLADQPLIDQLHLNKMISSFKSGHSIVTTSYRKDKEGVPAIFHKEYFEALSQLNDDIGAKHLIKGHKTFPINASDKIIDIDTKDDYDNILKNS